VPEQGTDFIDNKLQHLEEMVWTVDKGIAAQMPRFPAARTCCKDVAPSGAVLYHEGRRK